MKINPETFNDFFQNFKHTVELAGAESQAAFRHSTIGGDFGFIQIDSTKEFNLQLEIPREAIIFSFVMEGEVKHLSNAEDTEQIQTAAEILMMTYPFSQWKWEMKMAGGSSMLLLALSVAKLHEFFNKEVAKEGSGMDAVLQSYKLKRLFTVRRMTPSISVLTRQIFGNQVSDSFRKLFHQAKALEFISLFMDSQEASEVSIESCPYISGNLDLEKIRKARDIVTDSVANPPKISELARVVGTNEFKLKVGFKQLFGTTVYGYLNNYRMDLAMDILQKGDLQIKEVAYQVGYTNPSHFISAFKRKFGVTPKQYLLDLR